MCADLLLPCATSRRWSARIAADTHNHTHDCAQENRKKSAIVQKISNPKKLKALSKKKRAKLVTIPDGK